jgi:hypothetical protein
VAEPGKAARRVGRPERPLNPQDGPVSRFAHELRQLRAAAGYPTYRTLARRALYSASVLSSAAGGASFPTLEVTLAFARACGADPAEWRRRWEAAAGASEGGISPRSVAI